MFANQAYFTLYDLFKQIKNQYHILLVEDDKLTQHAMKQGLEKEFGYKYFCVDNALDAIHEWQTRKYDIIITDLRIIEKDEALKNGVDIARYIREQENQSDKKTPIFLYTTDRKDTINENDLALFDRTFDKPVDNWLKLDFEIQKHLTGNKLRLET